MTNSFDNPQNAINKLVLGNNIYLESCQNPADISPKIRFETTMMGQNPYAVILTCSDSRVVPEHIFTAGIGDLFVIRTAGNVVGDFELGSVEYGTLELGAKVVLIMGHTHCGAVVSALDEDKVLGHLDSVVHEIKLGLHDATNEETAIYNNILHSRNKILQSEIIQDLLRKGELAVVSACYDMAFGRVDFLDI